MKIPAKESEICNDQYVPKLLDTYDEDELQVEFLQKAPVCFLILGKPFTGKTTLAKKLAAEWKCLVISPSLLLQDAIASQSDIGNECKAILEKGDKVTDKVIFDMLQEKMTLPEIGNLGYVLDGFPTISEKFKSFNEQLDLLSTFPVVPNFVIRLKMSDRDVIKRRTQARQSTVTGLIHLQQEYAARRVKERMSDRDVIKRRTQARQSTVTGLIHLQQEYAARRVKERFKTFDEEEAEKRRKYGYDTEEEEEEDDEATSMLTSISEPPEFLLLPPSMIQNLVTPLEFMEDKVKAELNLYRRKVPQLEVFVAKFGRHCGMELDANLPPRKLFEGLLAGLRKMIVQRPILPIKMAFAVEADLESLDDSPLDLVLNILNKGSMIAPYFRWRASRWSKRCPVELLSGHIKNGRPVYSVAYRDTVYFLSSKDNCKAFFENPRIYLLPPMPKHPCKFIVFGHPRTGRTCLCRTLADKYEGKVIDVENLIKTSKKQKLCRKLQEVWVETTCSAMEEIQFQEVLDAALTAEVNRINELIMNAKLAAIANVKQKIEKRISATTKTVTMSIKSTLSATTTPSEEYYPYGDTSLTPVKLPKGMTGQDFEDMLPTAEELVQLAVTQLAEEGLIPEESLGMSIIADNHAEVVAQVDDALREAEEKGVEMTTAQQVDNLLAALVELEDERTEHHTKLCRSGGWVLDNFPTDPDLLQHTFDAGIIPSCIIILKDPTLDHSIAFRRWVESEGKRDFFGQLKSPTCTAEVEHREFDEEKQEHEDASSGEEKEYQLATPTTDLTPSGQPSQRDVTDRGSALPSIHTSQLTINELLPVTPADEIDVAGDTEVGPIEVGEEHGDETAYMGTDMEEHLPLPKDEKQIAYELKLEAYRTSLSQMEQFFEVVPYLLPKDNTIDFLKIDIASKIADLEEEGEEEMEAEGLEEELVKEEESAGHIKGTASDFSKDEEEAGIGQKTFDEITSEVLLGLRAIFMKQPREITLADKDTEDEDFAHNTSVLCNPYEPEEVQKENLRQLGDTSYFCPVKLKESWVLHPGKKSIEAKFKDKIYRFSTEEALKKFLQNASEYVSHNKPMNVPPLRLCILGPRGSGKSIHARALAKELNLFHIDFCERLQEVILPKTCRRLGFPYQVDQEQMDIDDAEMLAESVVESLFSSPAGSEEEEQSVLPEGTHLPSAGMSEQEDLEEEAEEESLEAGDEESTKGGSIHEIDDPGTELSEAEEEFTESMMTPTGTVTKSRRKGSGPFSAFEDEEEEEEYEIEAMEEEETDAMHRLFSNRELQIKDYLQRRTPLSTSVIEEIVLPWWTQEPYKSTGFVLEGFPSNRSEVEFLAHRGLTPDAVVFLRVDDLDVIQRYHSLCVDKWHKLLEYKRIKRAEARQIAMLKREAAIGARRRVLIEQKQRKLRLVASFKSSTASHFAEEENYMEEEEAVEDEEEESSIDIEALLVEEFPVIEEILEEEESSEDAQLRLNNMLLHMFQNDEDKVSSVKEVLEVLQVPCHVINAKRKPDKVTLSCLSAVGPMSLNRGSLLEKSYPITFIFAEKLVQTGYKMLSRFGWWCPVLLASCVVMPPYYGSTLQPFTVLHRNHVYYMSSENARQKFLANPVKYITQAAPRPDVPLTIAVVGPPKTGKTTLAKRFFKEHGMIRLSAGDAIRYVIDKLPHTVLADELVENLESGKSVSTEMLISSIKTAMMETRAQLQGVVLDGIPVTGEQVDKMMMKELVPFYIFELRQHISHTLERNRREREQIQRLYAYPDDDDLVQLRFQAVVDNIPAARNYYELEHHNWVILDSAHSKWWVWVKASAEFLQVVSSVQKYIVETSYERAVGIFHLCIAPHEFQANLDPAFGFYCPVSLALDNELADCTQFKDLKCAAEYKGKYYNMCSDQHLKLFIDDPTIFLPPLAPRTLPQPEFLPIALNTAQSRDIHHKFVEFGSYCPVSFVEGFQLYESLVPGCPEAAVRYCNRVYFCCNEAKREKFMKKPENYINLKLPYKRPPRKQPAHIMSLPLLGYLEQTVATMLIKALIAVGNLKPKYPFLDATRSAMLFLGYYLKANNQKQPPHIQNKYNNKINELKQRCQLLRYLTKYATRLPFHKGRRRPADFDEKMEEFFSLQLPASWYLTVPRLPRVLEL